MEWEVVGITVGALGLLVTLATIVWRAGRKQGKAEEKHGYSAEADKELREQIKDLQGRVRRLEEQEFNARLRDLRGQMNRMWDYVAPAAERYLRSGGAVRLRSMEELEEEDRRG